MTSATFKLARRCERLKASEIRELLKLTARPEIISFAGGLPAAELFPAREMAEITRRVLETEGCKALQYSTTEGDPTLRHHIAERMNRTQQTRVEADEILITSGSQQGLDLTGKLFLDPGDVVLCESPTYLGAINAFQAYEPGFVEVDTDDEGMVPAALEQALARHDRVKFVYAIPDFQNPSGRTWSLARRRALVEIAAREGVVVIEDSPYAELRFEGEPLPALHAVDTAGNVVFLGTFSKTFCPGLRCAWLAAPRALREKYVMVKQSADLHTSTLIQRQMAGYLELYGLEDNVRKVVDVYRERRDIMLGVFAEAMPEAVEITHPEGGLFLWLTFPGHVNARDLLEKSLEQHVAFVPGGAFFPNGGNENTARINFSCMQPEQIEEGSRRLCRVVAEVLG
ncbi:aminotransferase class I/II-fold pyridoxal phosphate-dependent enzyme [bacterium]|nr:aminotransferase class I/II-fold pyridoxal phosphate-dependent enzyme [bacterium]